jgi:hypothetical protein
MRFPAQSGHREQLIQQSDCSIQQLHVGKSVSKVRGAMTRSPEQMNSLYPHITDIRRARYRQLRELFDARPDQRNLPKYGRTARFAKASALSPRYLSHIDNRRKQIGDQLARQIERALGMPLNWMDSLSSAAQSASIASAALESEAAARLADKNVDDLEYRPGQLAAAARARSMARVQNATPGQREKSR